ncbi:MAG: precorrin-6Y C5,15-methyltransferase (decarboxylating) subunit CbiT [Methanosarcinales archaeon]|nr:precorrin-6Y C5,15-methyltransferase (decarboxylating) subunit CbiT [Methanosarcinales archaeon]
MQNLTPVSGGPTKPEVLAIALNKLALHPNDTFLDIGCGMASVSIAASKQCPAASISVIAIDDRPEAVSAAKENISNSGLGERITVIQGEAATALNDIDKADCAFIGGSRNIEAVLDVVASKVRRTIVVNAVRIETTARIITHMKKLGIFHEALHVQVSKSSELAGETYFKPENPVYIIVGNTIEHNRK